MSKTSLMDRRQLLLGLPAGAWLCFGCRNAAVVPGEEAAPETASEKHPFSRDSGMTVEEVFQFAYTAGSIPILKNLALELGPGRLLELLQKASSRNMEVMVENMTQDLPRRDFAAFVELNKQVLGEFPFSKAVVYEIVEETDRALEIHYKECLYAKTYRDAGAADIGHAVLCSATPSFASTFNPKITVSNPKNLMKGDSICIERYVLEV